MANYQRMIRATVILIIGVVVFIIGYVCLAWPLAYTTDALNKAWPTDPGTVAVVGSGAEIHNGEVNFNYFLAAAFLIGIALLFIWYWTYCHKEENEMD